MSAPRRSSRQPRESSDVEAFPTLSEGVQNGLRRLISDYADDVASMVDVKKEEDSSKDEKEFVDLLCEKCAKVMKQEQLTTSSFLARFFDVSMLSQHSEAALHKSPNGSAAVLADRIANAWAKNGTLFDAPKPPKREAKKEEPAVEKAKPDGKKTKGKKKAAKKEEKEEEDEEMEGDEKEDGEEKPAKKTKATKAKTAKPKKGDASATKAKPGRPSKKGKAAKEEDDAAAKEEGDEEEAKKEEEVANEDKETKDDDAAKEDEAAAKEDEVETKTNEEEAKAKDGKRKKGEETAAAPKKGRPSKKQAKEEKETK